MKLRRSIVLLALALLALSLALWLQFAPAGGDAPQADATSSKDARRKAAKEPAGRDWLRERLRPGDARQAQQTDARCRPYAGRACVAGDVYFVDSCGQPHDKQEECGDALCRDGACAAQQPERCAELPLHGRCEGEVARGCVGGVPYARDCAALGKRCVQTGEGAECRALEGQACEHAGPLPRCEGQHLLRCVEGEVAELDCGSRGAVCGQLAQQSPACHRIERRAAPPDPEDFCAPCGCPSDGLIGPELCDGRDNDEDGLFDEEVPCEPIPLVAFVVGDGPHGGSYAAEDLERELERIGRVLSVHPDLGLTVELLDVVPLDRPDWLELDDAEHAALLSAPELRLSRDDFYVPVVFTDALALGDTPKAGVSTLPNGRCGGRRVGGVAAPTAGAIVVAKGRSPTTVAHELGHFLGLCHTHFAHSDEVQRVVQWQSEDGAVVQQACRPGCAVEGDAMCDTPPDPGPEACAYDSACDVRCDRGQQPDPFNVMSYYTACRHAFSELQLRELRRNLHLRRAWHECRDARCRCEPHAPACPEEMSCRPAIGGQGDQQAWACSLDGARLPGELCEGHAQCGSSALCVRPGAGEPRCMRICDSDDASCRCVPAQALGVGLCREDAAGA